MALIPNRTRESTRVSNRDDRIDLSRNRTTNRHCDQPTSALFSTNKIEWWNKQLGQAKKKDKVQIEELQLLAPPFLLTFPPLLFFFHPDDDRPNVQVLGLPLTTKEKVIFRTLAFKVDVSQTQCRGFDGKWGGSWRMKSGSTWGCLSCCFGCSCGEPSAQSSRGIRDLF